MFTTTILTSWAGCPQSRLYQDVVARGDRHAVRLLTKVARQWDHTLAPAWLTRLVPRRLQPAAFDPQEYAVVVADLAADTLCATVEQVTWLRTQACVRESLRSVAFLETFETVVVDELERRRWGASARDAYPLTASGGCSVATVAVAGGELGLHPADDVEELDGEVADQLDRDGGPAAGVDQGDGVADGVVPAGATGLLHG
jgi:hypothetical protein